MLLRYTFLILIFTNIYAKHTLNNIYYIDSNSIKINNIINDSNNSTILFNIQKNKHNKKIKAKILLQKLKDNGYTDCEFRHKYINFVKKSPIDTTKIKHALEEYYKQNYKIIDIIDIIVEPRSYLRVLPTKYTTEIRSKNYLSSHGTISIKTQERKKIFFNYIIDAKVDIFVSKNKIKKKTELSAINTIKKSIILDKFKSKPIQKIAKSSLQSKHHISKDKILTIRDVEELSVIKKGSYISIEINNNNIDITFSAKALEDGRIGETIRVIKKNGKTLKAKVISKNKAEIK